MESIIAPDTSVTRGECVETTAVAPHFFDDAVPLVFVVDPDIALRQSLQLLIRSAGWDTEGFASAEDFLSYPRDSVPCCLILELTLPGLSGLELQQQLAGRPDVPVIFLTSIRDVATAVQAMKAGAVEFFIEPFNEATLVGVMEAAIERSRSALRHIAAVEALRQGYAALTPRERQVMRLVVSGLLNKQVGVELGINEATVKAHRGQVMRKMRADSLPDLVTMAMRLELLLMPRTYVHVDAMAIRHGLASNTEELCANGELRPGELARVRGQALPVSGLMAGRTPSTPGYTKRVGAR